MDRSPETTSATATAPVARVWRGATDAANAAAYFDHLSSAVLPRLATIPGHRGACVLRRAVDHGTGRVEFLVLTFWADMDAVRAFAGERPDVAVVEPAARAVLADFDDVVRHFAIARATGDAAALGGG